MTKVWIAVAVALLVSACATRSVPDGGQPAPGMLTLSIVGTNDLHGGVRARDGRGGSGAAWPGSNQSASEATKR